MVTYLFGVIVLWVVRPGPALHGWINRSHHSSAKPKTRTYLQQLGPKRRENGGWLSLGTNEKQRIPTWWIQVNPGESRCSGGCLAAPPGVVEVPTATRPAVFRMVGGRGRRAGGLSGPPQASSGGIGMKCLVDYNIHIVFFQETFFFPLFLGFSRFLDGFLMFSRDFLGHVELPEGVFGLWWSVFVGWLYIWIGLDS